LHREAKVSFDVAWEALTIDNLPGVIQVAVMVQLLGMVHRDIPSWNQVTHNPGSTGCPERFQFREIIRTLPELHAYPRAIESTEQARRLLMPAEAVPDEEQRALEMPVEGLDKDKDISAVDVRGGDR
jgi:hypothetical protein